MATLYTDTDTTTVHRKGAGEKIILFVILGLAAFLIFRIWQHHDSVNVKPVATTAPVLVTSTERSEHQEAASIIQPVIPKYTTSNRRLIATEKFGMSDVKNAVAATFSDISHKAAVVTGNGKGKSKVVKIRAPADQRHYFVADDLPDKEKAANKLAEIHRRAQYLLQAIDEQMDGNRRIKSGDGVDITDNMRTLVKKHYGKDIPLAEYNNPSDMTVGSNSDKGMMIETCLRGKHDPSEWNSDNTLFRVHMHELAHSADFEYREDGEEGHGPVFKRLHQYLLHVAENLGLYSCEEYKRSGGKFCSLRLSEEYCGAGGGPHHPGEIE